MPGWCVVMVLLHAAVCVRIFYQWASIHSAPTSPIVRACALHLLCWDVGFLHEAWSVLGGTARIPGGAPCFRVRARVIHQPVDP